MRALPGRLPLWAYAAALGGGFVVARVSSAGGGGSDAAVGDDAAASTDDASPSTGLWDNWGDSGASFDGSQGIGVLPTPYQGPGIGDYMDSPPIVTTPPPATIPPPSSTPPPRLPPPSSTPPPAPTGTLYSRPPGAPPSGAVGWIVATAGSAYYQAASSWDGSSTPVPIASQQAWPTTATRWVTATRNVRMPTGLVQSMRRVSSSGASAGTWLRNFVSTNHTVYSVNSASVRL